MHSLHHKCWSWRDAADYSRFFTDPASKSVTTARQKLAAEAVSGRIDRRIGRHLFTTPLIAKESLESTISTARVAGIDSFRGGWVIALVMLQGRQRDWQVLAAKNVVDAMALVATAHCVTIDIPIGLSEFAPLRICDGIARRLLGRCWPRVFAPPIRRILDASNYGQALDISRRFCGKGLSKQAWNIVPKIKQVDSYITPQHQDRVLEVHPELCFRELNGGTSLMESKKLVAGQVIREALLQSFLPTFTVIRALRQVADITGARPKPDDILDAIVAAWTAHRRLLGLSVVIPASPQRDGKGLRMEMHY